MRKAIIILLVLIVGVSGYFLYSSMTQNDASPGVQGSVIDLSGKNLNKISNSILDNKSVTKLDVSNNNLTGALPAEIRKLTNLEELIASDNKMTGIPAEIGQLSKLRIANFANNNISGLPLEIGNLSNLETLDLRGNPNVSTHDIGLIQSKIPNAKILVD